MLYKVDEGLVLICPGNSRALFDPNLISDASLLRKDIFIKGRSLYYPRPQDVITKLQTGVTCILHMHKAQPSRVHKRRASGPNPIVEKWPVQER